jgi:cell division protein FtsI (penicillin-binding protein 3)
MPTFSIFRAGGLLGGLVFLFIALCGRVAYLQTYGRQQTILRAERQQHQDVVLPARRGGIFDRNGVLMAGTIQTQTIFMDPKFMAEQLQDNHQAMDAALDKVAALTDQNPADLQKLLAQRPDSRFVKLAENLDAQTADQVLRLGVPGIGAIPANRRIYPMGSIACHILGGVGSDGSGIEGLELEYNRILSGKDGFERLTKDARRRPIGVAAQDYLPPRNGEHLVLTIDSNLQMMAQQELANACTTYQAQRGEVVVMDPRNGEVLAMADWLRGWPGFNPGDLGASPPQARRNFCITDPYEPGSTFKPFIAGPAFMWGVTTPGEIWPVHGDHYTAPDGRHVTDVESFYNLTTWDGLVKSSNILMSMLGERMGNARLHAAITSFGFGRRTGIDLPGESPGVVYPLKKWTHFSTESVCQGYEVMVTPLQLARAFCAIANGGRLVQPHLLLGTLDSDGQVLSPHPPQDFDQLPRVLDPATVVRLRRILCDVVIRGTAAGCRSPIWNIAGKTGTSYISDGKSGYSKTRFNGSFIACAPAEDPRLVVAFVLHDPTVKGHYGGTVAAPGACRLLEEALTYLNVPPSPPLPLPSPQIASRLWEFRLNQITNRNFGSGQTPNGM